MLLNLDWRRHAVTHNNHGESAAVDENKFACLSEGDIKNVKCRRWECKTANTTSYKLGQIILVVPITW